VQLPHACSEVDRLTNRLKYLLQTVEPAMVIAEA
jgi:hypothetical protein